MPKTGATRHQKFLKSEKSKTKLKAKKELPKGTNVTKTNFKVKKIVIKEQLQKHDDTEALTTRKLNVKELLSRLNHFNTHARKDALDGLKELINTHPQAIENNLGQLIHGLVPLILNVERTVRHEALKVIHLILSNIPAVKTEPFFDILSTYLRSSMTHIDNRIQEDSLLFLDTLLVCTPDRIAQDFHKIIPNFLDMISKLRIDSKPGRTLTINLESQLTSVRWRVKVLHRLQDYLEKFLKCNNIITVKRSIADVTLKFDERKLNYYPLYNPSFTSLCEVPCFSSKHFQENLTPQEEIEKFKSYIDTLMPLLFETWLEVCPNINKQKNMESVINEDAACLLKYSLEVINLVCQLVNYLDEKNPNCSFKNYYYQKYKQPFSQHIFLSFPFVTNIGRRSKGSNNTHQADEVISDPKMTMENLEICHLFIILNPNINFKNQKVDITNLINYIEKTFEQNSLENIKGRVIEILHTIFSDSVTNWIKNVSIMDSLLKKIISAYFDSDLSNDIKQKIFSLLCNSSLNDKLLHFHASQAFEKWLSNLPDILLETTITMATIDIIHKFATRNNKLFNNVIKPKLLKIINNLPNLKVTNYSHKSDSFKLYSLLFWIKCWDNDSLNLLESQLLNNLYESDVAKFIFDTLKIRSGGIYA